MVEAECELQTSSLMTAEASRAAPGKVGTSLLQQVSSYVAGSRDNLLIQSQLVTKVLLICSDYRAARRRRDGVGRENALDVEIKSPSKPWIYEPPIMRRPSIQED